MRKLVFLLLVLLTSASFNLNAQNFKFGHINTEELFVSMPETDSMQNKLKAYAKDLEEIYVGMRNEYEKKVQDFSDNQSKWSEPVKESKQRDLLELQKRIGEFEQGFQPKYQQEQQKLFAPIREKAVSAINKVAKANNFTYIFDMAQGSVVYFNETQSTDILPLVKKELGIAK